jgi:anti-anti-sigma factor
MNVKRNKTGAITFLSPDFALVDENMSLLDQEMKHCMEAGETRLVIDLNLVPYIDSSGLESLVNYYNMIRKEGGNIKVSNPNPLCNEILEITGMTKYFDIYFDLETAARSFL